jgi:hypothetical protein
MTAITVHGRQISRPMGHHLNVLMAVHTGQVMVSRGSKILKPHRGSMTSKTEVIVSQQGRGGPLQNPAGHHL